MPTDPATERTRPSEAEVLRGALEAVGGIHKAMVRDITAVLNRHSIENESNTPDFILAEFVRASLDAYASAVRAKNQWHGPTTPPLPSMVQSVTTTDDISATFPVAEPVTEAEKEAFVQGAKWWEFRQTGATLWPSDRDEAYAIAEQKILAGQRVAARAAGGE